MSVFQAIVAAAIFVVVAPWAQRQSHNWIASFKQWQMEDQYYRARKVQLLSYKREWEYCFDDLVDKRPPYQHLPAQSIDFLGKCVSDSIKSIDDELAQLKDYYGY